MADPAGQAGRLRRVPVLRLLSRVLAVLVPDPALVICPPPAEPDPPDRTGSHRDAPGQASRPGGTTPGPRDVADTGPGPRITWHDGTRPEGYPGQVDVAVGTGPATHAGGVAAALVLIDAAEAALGGPVQWRVWPCSCGLAASRPAR